MIEVTEMAYSFPDKYLKEIISHFLELLFLKDNKHKNLSFWR